MQPKSINPYSFAGAKHKEALDFIITNLPVDPTFENLNDVLCTGVFTADPEQPMLGNLAGVFLGVILPNAYNGYVNRTTPARTTDVIQSGGDDRQRFNTNTQYNEEQMLIINQMLEDIKQVPVESIGTFLSSVEDSIVSSGLTYQEQVPLFIATSSGKGEHEYWMNQIASPGAWITYLDPNPAINYMHLPFVVSAAMQGALLTYGLVKPPQLQPLDVFTSLVGSIGLAAGKVVFGWTPLSS